MSLALRRTLFKGQAYIRRSLLSTYSGPSNGAPPEGGIDRSAILTASLPYVKEHGWSIAAVSYGARSLELPGVVHGLFPRGGVELVDHFESLCNQQLVEFLQQSTSGELPSQGTRLVSQAVKWRLRMLMPYISQWPQAMALKASPSNIRYALLSLTTITDDIWYYAGDRSTDFNWYTKRGLLAAIYCSTEIHMVQDQSVDFQDTWDFLKRRFQDTRTITSSIQEVEQLFCSSYQLASAGLTTFQNILGMNSWRRWR